VNRALQIPACAIVAGVLACGPAAEGLVRQDKPRRLARENPEVHRFFDRQACVPRLTRATSFSAVRYAGSCQNSSAAPPDSPAGTSLSGAPSNESTVRFGGEVLKGQFFERDIGHGLLFRLDPSEADETGGWVIEILPKAQPSDGPAEFTAIATPPYHFYNERYVEGVYGYSPREAVQITLRKFYFVSSLGDQQIASDVVNAALYPSTSSEQEKARVAAEAAGLQLGRGELHIVRSRVTPGKAGTSDAIAWIKFEVSLDFTPGVTLQQVLTPTPSKAATH
jgi:hypothetical protein